MSRRPAKPDTVPLTATAAWPASQKLNLPPSPPHLISSYWMAWPKIVDITSTPSTYVHILYLLFHSVVFDTRLSNLGL